MKVVFETVTLADVVKRAATVAPSRGDAFDKAAGIVMELNPGGEVECMIKATDTVLYYTEAVSTLSVTGMQGITTWRIPSSLFAAFTSKLPLGSGAQVELEVAPNTNIMSLTCRRLKAKINLIQDQFYPAWGPFDADKLAAVPDFGSIVRAALWASTSNGSDLEGVGVGPAFVGCTDRYRLAFTMCSTGMSETFLVPSRVLPSLLPMQGEVKIGLEGSTFLVMPNDWTQIRTAIIEDKFPDLSRFLTKGDEYTYTSHFNKSEVLPMIAQALDFKGGNRQSEVSLILGKGEVAVYVNNSEVGLFGNVADSWGDSESHPRVTIKFNPDNLRAALQNFPGEIVSMQYNPFGHKNTKVYLNNEGDYHAMVMPLKAPPAQKEESSDAQ